MSPAYVCIHAHFYQPPRENPWLEAVAPDPTAAPYHDWNDRICAECYRPNSAARILDEHGRIARIVNNYAGISFNFGPTLMSWLETEARPVYDAILEADRASQQRFSGHGSAIAQAYNHVLMPLANDRDKATQVRWGIRDFQRRFGRDPEGMWLPETGCDTPTLEALAAESIAFTILAPHQALRVRPIGDKQWHDVSGSRVDTSRVYRANLPSGRSIDLFFYDGPISRAVAFENLLSDGERFTGRLLSAHPSDGRLSHIATDGETYGHHHRHGDMALARAIDIVEKHDGARLTNYGEFRELHPAQWEVEIAEETSWSCAHGVRRWADDCGCASGGRPEWHQKWRQPLRKALDAARDRIATLFESQGGELFRDPWAVRDDYIEVVLDRTADTIDGFLRRHTERSVDPKLRSRALRLLEMQRNAMLMYTSCGWFFDDVSGIEGAQVLRYAARAVELAGALGDEDAEPELRTLLERAPSNVDKYQNGRGVYEQLVTPSRVGLRDVVAHYAVMHLLARDEPLQRIHCYEVRAVRTERHSAGNSTLSIGHVDAGSLITGELGRFCFAALHLGEHSLTGGVRRFLSADAYERIVTDVSEPFVRADLVATQRAIDQHFEDRAFSLGSLFPAYRARAIEQILRIPIAEAESSYLRMYRHNGPLIRYLTHHQLPVPAVLRGLRATVVGLRVRHALVREPPDLAEIRSAIRDVDPEAGEPDADLGRAWQQALERVAGSFAAQPGAAARLALLADLLELAEAAGVTVDLWLVQNIAWRLVREELPGPDEAWAAELTRVCRALRLRLEER